MLMKLWDWDRKWMCSQVFKGQTHYVMQVVISPEDNDQFASTSLDWTAKAHTHKNKLKHTYMQIQYLKDNRKWLL